ncbi:MAG: hypothetical protein ABI411_05450 [Tahibacter sp.]
MSRKGWQRLFIDGVMLFGERHEHSLKRGAAGGSGAISFFAAATA